LLELGAGFNAEFTGRENVFLNASLLGQSRQETEARFKQIEDFAGIGDFIDQPVKTYSSGMMVRLGFAVIAHVDADILIIDEALSVGDAFFTQKCMRFLRSFMKTGTILFVSHDTSSVRSLCNRTIWIDKGRILMQGSPKEVCNKYLEAFYEAQQGKSVISKSKQNQTPNSYDKAIFTDPRLKYINSSNLRNDLRIFQFSLDSEGFGKSGAKISNVKFLDENDQPLSWIIGGEIVCLRIEAMAYETLDTPIIGFLIKDKMGQPLFGENTFLSYLDNPVKCVPGDLLRANFVFQMPRLAAGDYSITVAIANGTQDNHVQHHWIHDALLFKSESTSVANGLIGIPMAQVELNITE
jgi:lipopolysaccharide transport system ATP-binding protein